MKSLVQNGEVVATCNMEYDLTKEAYDALPEEDKTNESVTYFVNDFTDTDHQRLVTISGELGNVENLSGLADGTVFGCIKDLYDRLGGLFLSVDPEFQYLQVQDVNNTTSTALPEFSETASDQEKIAWLRAIMGDSADLQETGYTSVVNAIVDMYSRLNALSFSLSEAGILTITDTEAE